MLLKERFMLRINQGKPIRLKNLLLLDLLVAVKRILKIRIKMRMLQIKLQMQKEMKLMPKRSLIMQLKKEQRIETEPGKQLNLEAVKVAELRVQQTLELTNLRTDRNTLLPHVLQRDKNLLKKSNTSIFSESVLIF